MAPILSPQHCHPGEQMGPQERCVVARVFLMAMTTSGGAGGGH